MSLKRIVHNCDEIVKSYTQSDYQVSFDLKPLEMGPPETRVRDVIVRVYNRNATVFINEKLNLFIHHIVKELNLLKLSEAP